MTALEAIFEELKTLPPSKLEKAATVVHELVKEWESEKGHTFDDLSGCMSEDEANRLETAIADTCERIDANEW